jgi:HNH endonuclease
VRVRLCRGCGSALSKRSQKVYCGNACQASVRRDTSTKRWLESGEARINGHHGHYIRQYLADAQSGCCAICGRASAWLGLPLTLVLDHIDGDSTNNRRENLRLICPNCDSQLPTYKSRNRGNGRNYRRQRYANGQSH